MGRVRAAILRLTTPRHWCGLCATLAAFNDVDDVEPCAWCGWDETVSEQHAEDCGR